MPDSPTPGETAYTAYHASISNPYYVRYEHLGPLVQQQWEAAAQAVLVQWWQAHEAIICGDDEEERDDA